MPAPVGVQAEPISGGGTSTKRLKELERENQRLKRIVTDKELEIDAWREISKGNI